MTNLHVALAVGALALTIVSTGSAMSCSVNSTAVTLHGELRQDIRTLNADVKDLGERVTRVEVLLSRFESPRDAAGARSPGTN